MCLDTSMAESPSATLARGTRPEPAPSHRHPRLQIAIAPPPLRPGDRFQRLARFGLSREHLDHPLQVVADGP